MSQHAPRTRLRSLRKKAGLTQADLAFLLCLKRSAAISKIECCHTTISVHVLISCCIIFECTLDDLLPELTHDCIKVTKTNACTLLNLEQGSKSVRTVQRKDTLQALITRMQ